MIRNRALSFLPLAAVLAPSLVALPTASHAAAPEESGGGGLSMSADAQVGPEGTDADADADADAAAEVDPAADADVSDASTNEDAPPPKQSKWNKREDQKWIKRWAPENNMAEIGLYGGILLVAESHELFRPDLDLPLQGYQPLRSLNPDIGIRAGYYPLRFFGVEAEGGVMPSAVADGGDSALLYTVRGHVVGQLGLWSVTPFVLLGAGGLGVSSPRSALGNDLDPALHFGGGVKVYLNRWAMLRLDVRDVVSHKQAVDETFKSHNLEVLLGLSVTLGRKNTPPAPSDRDGDGFLDHEDTCPDDPGVEPDGCPILDKDGDGINDDVDQCVDEAETFNEYQDEDGCPESDRDGDGFWDDQDTCPDEAGVDPDGCPIPDTDGDGLTDDVDQCIEEPESANGYQDEDGCPDEVPKALARFTGAIKGINFETNSDEIRSSSSGTLDKAVKVLKEFPDIRIKITGHTDSQGDHDKNVDLSKRRAASVKTYFVEHGIDTSRIETTGEGPDKPVDTNDTKAGRANNRRIEFEILTQKPGRAVSAEAAAEPTEG